MQVARIATYKETRADGFIGVDLDQGIGSKFDMTFKMRTKEKEGLMVYMADDTQVSFVVVVFFVWKRVAQQSKLTNSIKTYKFWSLSLHLPKNL